MSTRTEKLISAIWGFVNVILLIALLLVLIGLAAVFSDDEPEENLYLKHHCEMVYLFATSKGEYGWPDYNNTAHLCVENQP